MRLRTPARERRNAASRTGPTADASAVRRLGKHLLSAAGILAITYAVLRVFGPRDDVPVQSVDEVQADVADVVPDGIQSRAAGAVPGDRIDTIRNRVGTSVPDDITEISIDGPRSEASPTDIDIESPTGTDEGGSGDADVTGLDDGGDADGDESGTDDTGGDTIDETAANADYTDDERSDEEIAERAESDVQDEPAEPGEMAVDEDIAEDVADADEAADVESDESEE